MKEVNLMHGYTRREHDDGRVEFIKTRKEPYDAVEGSNVKVEVGQLEVGQQEGAESKEPETSDSNHVVGEASSEARQERLPEE